MSNIIRFSVNDGVAKFGKKTRKSLTKKGCNEPFKDRYWCPKRKWFSKKPCCFSNRRECTNYDIQVNGQCF